MVVLILAFLLISGQFILSNSKVLQHPALDFSVLYNAGWQVLNKQDPYLQKADSSFHTPPPSLLVFALLPLLPIGASQAAWYILSFAAFILGSYFLFKTLEKFGGSTAFHALDGKVWLVYLSLVLVYFPFRFNLGSGEVNNFLFLFLAMVFYYWQQRRELGIVLPLALGIIIKITPLFFLLVFFLERRWKLILFTGIWLMALSLMTVLFFGWEIFTSYVAVIPRYFNLLTPVYYNQSLAATVGRISHDLLVSRWLSIVTLAVALLVFVSYQSKLPKNAFKTDVLVWNISILYTLIFSTFAWQHHFTIAIFPLVTTLSLLVQLKNSKRFFFLLTLSYVLLGINIKSSTIFTDWGLPGAIILSHVFWGALLLLLLNYRLASRLIAEKQ